MIVSDELTGFRHAQWDSPWWVNENRNAGRFNRAGQEATQYLCLHPLGVSAEFLRRLGPDSVADVDLATMRVWAVRLPMDGLERITFDTASSFGLRPEALVDDDYTATQDLGDYLRTTGRAGLIAPSAALPGTETLVLFGPRLRLPFLLQPIEPRQVPTAHITDGPPVSEVIPHVRWFGAPHEGFREWQATGAMRVLEDPPTARRSGFGE